MGLQNPHELLTICTRLAHSQGCSEAIDGNLWNSWQSWQFLNWFSWLFGWLQATKHSSGRIFSSAEFQEEVNVAVLKLLSNQVVKQWYMHSTTGNHHHSCTLISSLLWKWGNIGTLVGSCLNPFYTHTHTTPVSISIFDLKLVSTQSQHPVLQVSRSHDRYSFSVFKELYQCFMICDELKWMTQSLQTLGQFLLYQVVSTVFWQAIRCISH